MKILVWSALAVYVILWTLFSFLYPLSGDDFLFFSDVARLGIGGNVGWMFTHWTCRLGTVVMCGLAGTGGRWLFSVLNPFFLIGTVLLLGKLVLSCRIRWRNREGGMLLLWLAGMMAFAARPRDTFYWMAGATGYLWSGCVTLLFFCLLRQWREESSVWKNALLCLFGAAAGYANENTAIVGGLLLVLWLFCTKEWRKAPAVFGFLAGGALLFLNPGFAVRARAAGAGGLVWRQLGVMISRLPELVLFWGVAVAVPLAATCGILLYLAFRRKWTLREWLPVLGWWGVSFACSLVFAGGPLPAMRAHYFSSLMGIAGSAAAFQILLTESPRCGRKLAWAMAAAGLLVLGLAVPDFVKIHQDDAERTVLVAAARRRFGEQAEVVVPEHRVLRRRFWQYIYVEDLSCDPAFWLNTGAARFYGVKSIAVRERGRRPATYRDKLFPSSRPQEGVTPGSK